MAKMPREGGGQEAEEPGQDLRHGRLRERRHGHGFLQGPEAARRRPERSPAPPPRGRRRQVGGRRALPRGQQLLLVALAHPAGAHLQVVRGAAGSVGVDVRPVHAPVRAARLLPPAGPQRLEDPLALRALLLRLLGRVRVRRHVLPAVVVHLREGPALLRHVQPALHRDHHRVRRRRPPRRAARRQLAGRDRRHRGAVRGAVGQSGRRQQGRGGARAPLGRSGEDVISAVGSQFDGRRRQWHRRAPPGGRRSNGEVDGILLLFKCSVRARAVFSGSVC
uniref:Uncharacterized protein n=1 Tax=Zea mays TaxID=4577 RepID=C0PKS7_MAIZE|nr:unknown [Zea mays]